MARRRFAVMPVIGLGVVSTAVSWMITHAVPVTVRSASESRSAGPSPGTTRI